MKPKEYMILSPSFILVTGHDPVAESDVAAVLQEPVFATIQVPEVGSVVEVEHQSHPFVFGPRQPEHDVWEEHGRTQVRVKGTEQELFLELAIHCSVEAHQVHTCPEPS